MGLLMVEDLLRVIPSHSLAGPADIARRQEVEELRAKELVVLELDIKEL